MDGRGAGSRLGALLVLVAAGGTGCIDQPGDTTSASSSLTVPPPGVGCLVVSAKPPSLPQPVVQSATLVSGTTASFDMGTLPSGPVIFHASGYAGACPATTAAMWTSNDQIITVTPGVHANVDMTFQPGAVAVVVSYTGTAATCPPGEFQCFAPKGGLDHCSTHPSHHRCGVYCRECRLGERCLNGMCTRASSSQCPAGQFRCVLPDGSVDECSDHSSDPAACGPSCTPCGATQSCMSGVCTTPPPTCPDGVIGPGEQCDGANLGGATCASLGFPAGSLSCTGGCVYDTSGCSTCGNGTLEGSEVCDGANLGGQTCEGLGHDGGTPSCAASCLAFDETTCSDCGNGVREGSEPCDGADLGGATCASLGFTAGTPSCSAGCGYDTSGCTTCGNGVREGSEPCDGADLGGQTCKSIGQGFTGGTLACTPSCTLDTTGCTTPPPPSDGLVFWVKGDSGLAKSSDGLRMLTWANSAPASFNPGLTSAGADAQYGALVDLETIDGIKAVTFPNSTTYLLMQIIVAGNAALMKDHTGVPFGYGVGETQQRTVFTVHRPTFDPANFQITGGALLRFGQSLGPGASPQDFECFFRLQDLPNGHTNGFALLANDWPNHFEDALYGPDTPGSTYAGVPVVVQWSSPGFPDITVRINGVPVALTPNVMQPPGDNHPVHDFFTFGSVDQIDDINNYNRYRGAISEQLIYDVDLESDPAALTQTYQYFARRYPSIAVTIP